MKINSNIILFIFLNFLSIVAFAQKLSEIKPVKVGDTMPDIVLANIFRHQNTKGGTLMKEFGGKPLILDLWFTTCTPCVGAMPFMDSLQKENVGKLNILLVDYVTREIESVENVKKLLTQNPYLKNVTLPTTIMDSVMAKLFPKGEPCQVWIDEQGIVRSISESGQVTRENVKTFLSGKPLALTQVKIENDPYRDGHNIPLMVIDQNFNKGKGLRFYSYISGYDSVTNYSPLRFGAPYILDNKNLKIHITNSDLFQLYQFVDADFKNKHRDDIRYDLLKPYQFILENPDRFRRLYPDASIYIPDSRDFSKLYSYEMLSTDTTVKKAYQIMKNDLDNFFNLESIFGFKKLPCYVLRRIDPTKDLLISKGGPSGHSLRRSKITIANDEWWLVRRFLNTTSRYFIKNDLSTYCLPYQVFDETGYNDTMKIDIEIPGLSPDWENLSVVNEKLKKYNLVMSVEDRELEVIVLKDRL